MSNAIKVEEKFRCRNCNNNLSSNNPASQYQRQKLIQNTVRVKSSLYTMNLAGLSSYQRPSNKYQLVEQSGTPYIAPPRVNWNQMSDRASPSVQKLVTSSGSTYHGSSKRRSLVRERPGAMSPGGVGVDVKHNSYERYLNRLKGKAPLRRGLVPPGYGSPIEFNRAYPIYGGKVVKTNIVNGCDCVEQNESDKRIYSSKNNAIQDEIYSVKYEFHVGDFVLAKKYATDNKLYKAQIMNIENEIYTIKFVDDNTVMTTDASNILIFFDCSGCNAITAEDSIFDNGLTADELSRYFEFNANIYCNILNLLSASQIF